MTKSNNRKEGAYPNLLLVFETHTKRRNNKERARAKGQSESERDNARRSVGVAAPSCVSLLADDLPGEVCASGG